MLLGLNVRNLFTHEVKTFLCFKRLRTLRWRYTKKVSNIQLILLAFILILGGDTPM